MALIWASYQYMVISHWKYKNMWWKNLHIQTFFLFYHLLGQGSNGLIHCVKGTSYGTTEFYRHWFRCWFGAKQMTNIVIVFFIFLYLDICNYICLDTSYHFLALSLLLKYSLFFKYSCTNIFYRRSLYIFYHLNQRWWSSTTNDDLLSTGPKQVQWNLNQNTFSFLKMQ